MSVVRLGVFVMLYVVASIGPDGQQIDGVYTSEAAALANMRDDQAVTEFEPNRDVSDVWTFRMRTLATGWRDVVALREQE